MVAPAREQWGSRLGFFMAAIGSAVGLGNMWRFSYLTAENGGAAFVLVYLGLMLVVGLPLLLAELTIGRGARKSPIGAFIHYGGRAWAPLGATFVFAIVFLSYYFVIAGWTVRYAVEAVSIGLPGDGAAHFHSVATGPGAIGWHLGFVAVTAAVLLSGVRAGIERTALVLMPTLLLVICGIALYASTLEGAGAGYHYYLAPNFGDLLTQKVLTDAASQAFFSLSIGLGVMLTFASYLSDDHHLPNAALAIAFADFAVAFIAGLAVFPVLFALGDPAALADGSLGTLFVTLPLAFAEMGRAGWAVGLVFFSALAIAALTSTVAALEVVVATAIDSLGWQRRRSVLIAGSVAALLGIAPALDLELLDWMDGLAGAVLVLGGLGLAIFAGWFMPDAMVEVSKGAAGVRWFVLWRWLLRVPVPLGLALVLYASLVELWE